MKNWKVDVDRDVKGINDEASGVVTEATLWFESSQVTWRRRRLIKSCRKAMRSSTWHISLIQPRPKLSVISIISITFRNLTLSYNSIEQKRFSLHSPTATKTLSINITHDDLQKHFFVSFALPNHFSLPPALVVELIQEATCKNFHFTSQWILDYVFATGKFSLLARFAWDTKKIGGIEFHFASRYMQATRTLRMRHIEQSLI